MREIKRTDGKLYMHKWKFISEFEITACGKCGVVLNRDRSNKEGRCPGLAKVRGRR